MFLKLIVHSIDLITCVRLWDRISFVWNPSTDTEACRCGGFVNQTTLISSFELLISFTSTISRRYGCCDYWLGHWCLHLKEYCLFPWGKRLIHPRRWRRRRLKYSKMQFTSDVIFERNFLESSYALIFELLFSTKKKLSNTSFQMSMKCDKVLIMKKFISSMHKKRFRCTKSGHIYLILETRNEISSGCMKKMHFLLSYFIQF